MSEAPPLTDQEFDAAFREGATDEDIEAVLRDLVFWSYIMRNPFGKVCALGRGGTRADCILNAFKLADDHAIDCFSVLEDPQDEVLALNGAWVALVSPR